MPRPSGADRRPTAAPAPARTAPAPTAPKRRRRDSPGRDSARPVSSDWLSFRSYCPATTPCTWLTSADNASIFWDSA
ncbi:hypothetical protein GS506_11385 [Rhodococcus hoagii]|nr:hypothetical protein [Prescottella equi]